MCPDCNSNLFNLCVKQSSAESNKDSEHNSDYASDDNKVKEEFSDKGKDLDNNKVEDLHKDLKPKESSIMARNSKSSATASCSTHKKASNNGNDLNTPMGKLMIGANPSFKRYSIAAGVLAWSLNTVEGENHEEVFIDLIVPTLPVKAYKIIVSPDGRTLEALVGCLRWFFGGGLHAEDVL